MINQNTDYYFLQGGGEMGALIRAKDWSKTSLGHPAGWPQSLRTMVAVMLDNPFGMYIAWGNDYIQLYNDGYRPILGSTKHPQALGISTRQTFSEIWYIIESMFDGVMQGKAVGFPDFMLPLNRNGYEEECFFDFSYSPIRTDNGEVGGVLVTVIETTSKKKAEEALKESEQRFKDTVKQAPVGITVLKGKEYMVEMANDPYLQLINRKENEFVGRPLFEALPEVKQSVHALLENVLNTGVPFQGNEVPIPLNRHGSVEVFYFDFLYYPLKEKNGAVSGVVVTVTEVTDKVKAGKKLKENEKLLESVFINAPAAIAVITGPDHSYVLANAEYQKMVGRTKQQLLGNTSKSIFPELTDSGTFEIFDRIYQTGEEFSLAEYAAKIDKNADGIMEEMFFRFSAVPLKDSAGVFDSIVIVAVDITEQVLARKKIEQSENRFQLLVRDTSAAIIVLTGDDMKVEIVNEAYGRLINLKPADLLNKPLFSVVPEGAAYYLPILEKVRQTGEMLHLYDSPYAVTVNGKYIEGFLNIIYQPYRDTDGNIVGVMAILQDVTETVLARKRIEQSEQRFQAAIKAVQGILWTNNGKGEMEGEQPGWANLTGQTYEEYQGYGWAKAIHPDDAEPTVNAWNKAVQEQKPFIFEHRVKIKNGQWRNFSIRAIPLADNDGTLRQWVGVHTDITEQIEALQKIKESEERFRSLAHTLPQLVWVTDNQANPEFTSVRWKEYSGIEPRGEAEWKAIVHPDDYDGINAAWRHSLATGSMYKYDVRLKSKEGVYRWHHVNGEPVHDNENNIIKWVGAFTDVHEQKINDERKDEFISVASHELKTPVTTVKGYLQILAHSLDGANKEVSLYIQKANQGADRLNDLISELLDVSKIRLGKLNYTITSFDFNALVDSTVENMQLISRSHTIIKTGKINDEVRGDKARLQQVLINLLNNAIKYSPTAKEVFIDITQELDQIKVSVKDNGIGIGGKSLDKIFDKYHRVEEHAAHFQGLGIGLFISYEIVERHGGKLWAESELGKGSTFYFTIPLNGGIL